MFGFSKDGQHYSKLGGEPDVCDRPGRSYSRNAHIFHAIINIFTVILVGTVSFWAGRHSSGCQNNADTSMVTIQYAPTPAYRIQKVREQPLMAEPCPADGSHEPAWDALLPNGLGFIKHPTLAPELAAVGVFHQLHCLYTIRRAYFAAYAKSMGHSFDMIGVRDSKHVAHCFTYIQQAMVCASENGIEPHRISGPQHTHFDRQCRDFDQLKAWAEEWRAFDGHGFLFDKLGNHTSDASV